MSQRTEAWLQPEAGGWRGMWSLVSMDGWLLHALSVSDETKGLTWKTGWMEMSEGEHTEWEEEEDYNTEEEEEEKDRVCCRRWDATLLRPAETPDTRTDMLTCFVYATKKTYKLSFSVAAEFVVDFIMLLCTMLYRNLLADGVHAAVN